MNVKQNVLYLYSRILFSQKKINEISIHSKTRMNLGNILLGEMSQTQKNKWQMIYYSIYIWRRQWHPTPVLLPGKSHGQRSLVGCGHGVAKSRTQLSNFTFTFHFHALEKEMATHSSVLAWRIPGTGEPSGLQSMGSHGAGHDWGDLAAAAAALQANPQKQSRIGVSGVGGREG